MVKGREEGIKVIKAINFLTFLMNRKRQTEGEMIRSRNRNEWMRTAKCRKKVAKEEEEAS